MHRRIARCVHTHTYTPTHTHTHTQIDGRTYKDSHTRTHIDGRTYTHTHTHTHVGIYTLRHIHKHRVHQLARGVLLDKGKQTQITPTKVHTLGKLVPQMAH